MMKQAIAIVAGIMASFLMTGTAAAYVVIGPLDLKDKRDRETLVSVLASKGVAIPKAALPELKLPVSLTIAFDEETKELGIVITGKADLKAVSKEDLAHVLEMVQKAFPTATTVSLTTYDADKKARVEYLGPPEVEVPKAKEAPESPKVSKAPEAPQKPETKAEFHPDENATKEFPKELENGMTLEKTVRESGHGFEMTITRPEKPSHETPSAANHDELLQRRNVQAQGLRTPQNPGMVDGLNPLSKTLGGKAYRGRR